MENTRFYPSLLPVITSVFSGLFIALWVFIATSFAFPFNIILVPIALALPAIITYFSLKMTWLEFTDEGLTVRRGIITEKRSTFLYSQIQDIKEAQTFVQMILGIKELRIVTMTGMSAVAGVLPAFKTGEAEKIKEMLFERVENPEKSKAAAETAKPEEEAENPYKVNYIYGIVLPIFAIGMLVLLSIIGIAIFGFDALSPLLSVWFYLFFFVLGIAGYIIHLATIKYKVSNSKFEISYGLFSMQKSTFKIEKTQDIVISRNIFDSFFGLANFKAESGSVDFVYTGNNSKNLLMVDTKLPFLRKGDAYELMDFFFRQLGLDQKQQQPPLIEQFPLDGKKPMKKTIGFFISFGIFLAIVSAVLMWLAPAMAGLVIVIIAGLIALTALKYVFEMLYFRSYYYNCSQDILYIRKGVITITEIAIPFEKIQNVFINQDFFDMVFGLYDLHLSTVTPTSGMQSHIDGLDKQNAQGLRDLLLGKIKPK